MSVLASTSRNVLRRGRANVRSCGASSATWHAKCIGYSWLLEPLLLPSRGLDRHKKIGGCYRKRRMAQSGLEGDASQKHRPTQACIRGRDGHQHLVFSAVCLLSKRKKGLREGSAQPRGEHDTACEHEPEGDGSVPGGARPYNRPGLRGLHRKSTRT